MNGPGHWNPDGRDAGSANAALAATLVDEWARAGMRHAALAPGSRSTPLALALAADGRIRLSVHLDERSAAFFALGAAKATGTPAAVLCTSGTAAAHFHAAVLEARHAGVALLVCTADRPAELRRTGAAQTTDQVKLYGDAVRFYGELGSDADPAAVAGWRPLAARAYTEAAGPPAGPVHLNLAFREPLLAAVPPDLPPGRPGGEPWTRTIRAEPQLTGDELDRLAARLGRTERGLIVAGWSRAGAAPPAAVSALAASTGWPVLADPLSGLRGRAANEVVAYEGLLRVGGFAEGARPDLVVRLGAPPTSKALDGWLAGVPQLVFDPDRMWLDPGRRADQRIEAPLTEALAARVVAAPARGWLQEWLAADRAAVAALAAALDSGGLSEGRVARDVARAAGVLVVGSSMPVRDLDAFADHCPERVFCNRGLNGIDGFTSTAAGIAAALAPEPVTAICGDLTFLHDAAGLFGLAVRRDLHLTVVVVDNDGGGIFSFLPQAAALSPDRFEELFGTPHRLDVAAVAAAYNLPATRLDDPDGLARALKESAAAGPGVRIVVAATGDRSVNVAAHHAAWQAVAEAVTPG